MMLMNGQKSFNSHPAGRAGDGQRHFADLLKYWVSIRIPLGERVMDYVTALEWSGTGFNSHPARRAGDGLMALSGYLSLVFQFASRSESG